MILFNRKNGKRTHVGREDIGIVSVQHFTLEIRRQRAYSLVVVLEGNVTGAFTMNHNTNP